MLSITYSAGTALTSYRPFAKVATMAEARAKIKEYAAKGSRELLAFDLDDEYENCADAAVADSGDIALFCIQPEGFKL